MSPFDEWFIFLLIAGCLDLSRSDVSLPIDSNITLENAAPDDSLNGSAGTELPSVNEGVSPGLAVYRQVLRTKRMEQRKSILMLHDIADLKKQAKLSKPAIEKIVEILAQQRLLARPNITTDFESLSSTEKESLSTVLENVLFLGDFVLRLPDTTQKLLKKTQGAGETVHWAVAYASSLNYLEETDLKVLDLMAQELNLIPRREGYVNIYTEKYKQQQADAEKRAAKEAAKTKKPDRKKKNRPLMSGPFPDEL